MKSHPVITAILTVLLVAATAIGSNYRLEAERADRRAEGCLRDQRQYDVLHALIAETAKPSAQGSSIDRLVIPPDTPPSVIEILRQLNSSQTPPNPHALDRYFKVLDGRPQC